MRKPESRFRLFVTGVIVCVFGVTAASAAAYQNGWHRPPNDLPGPVTDLLHQDWRYLDGVTQTNTALRVTATNSKIVNQDGSGGQPNPPVNLYGTHLSVGGDFRIAAHLSKQHDTTATLRLYTKPPVIADEFRIEPAGIAVTEQNNTLSVQIWNGSEPEHVTNPRPFFSTRSTLSNPNTDIVISRSDRRLIIQAGTTTITSKNTGNIFRSGTVWFGLDSSNGDFTVDKLTAQSLNGDKLAIIDSADHTRSLRSVLPGLRDRTELLRPGFTIGAAAALGPWASDATYAAQLTQNFSAITPEDAMKPQFISPRPGVYTFQEADALVALAHQNGMAVHGHTLAFSEAEPSWMRHLPTATAADRASTSTALLNYVSQVVQHFKGQVDSWDVINEPLDTNQGTSLQKNIWYKAMGPGYMVQVSKLVHAIDPEVKQYVNENGAELAGKRQDTLLKLAQTINAQGGFIDGVGLQAHVYDMHTDAIDPNKLNATINRFGAAGFKVRISENDVTDDSGTAAQANQYAAVFVTCLKNPNCVSYTTWGVNDNYDWFVDDDGSLEQGHDFLFNGVHPTRAYAALVKGFR